MATETVTAANGAEIRSLTDGEAEPGIYPAILQAWLAVEAEHARVSEVVARLGREVRAQYTGYDPEGGTLEDAGRRVTAVQEVVFELPTQIVGHDFDSLIHALRSACQLPGAQIAYRQGEADRAAKQRDEQAERAALVAEAEATHGARLEALRRGETPEPLSELHRLVMAGDIAGAIRMIHRGETNDQARGLRAASQHAIGRVG